MTLPTIRTFTVDITLSEKEYKEVCKYLEETKEISFQDALEWYANEELLNEAVDHEILVQEEREKCNK